jgi:hypothetical protein
MLQVVTEYDDAPAAVAAGNPISPDVLVQRTLRIAAIIVEQGAATISSTVDQRPKLGQFAATAGAVTKHALLTGLGNDDHPQYLLANGGRALAGDLDLGTHNITNVGTVAGLDIADHHDRHESGGLDEVDGDILDIDFAPLNYVPDTTDPLAPSVADLTAHLKGIDNFVGSFTTAAFTNILQAMT